MKCRLSRVAATTALLASSAAFSQAYVGVGAGPSKIDINCAGTTTCDKTDTGFKLYGGLNWWGPFAAEATYFDWGKADSSLAVVGGTSALNTRANGIGLGAAYFLRLAWGECVARAGAARNRAKTTVTLNGASTEDRFSSIEPYYGIGCGYPIAPNWTLTAEADFSRVKYTASDKANVQLFSLGIRHSF